MAERNLAAMLATLSARVRPGRFVFVAVPRALRDRSEVPDAATHSTANAAGGKANVAQATPASGNRAHSPRALRADRHGQRAPRPAAFDMQVLALADAVIHEDEGTTCVVRDDLLDAAGDPDGRAADAFRAAWLTLDVVSALDAVGLTAAVASALAEAGIACNVIAGLHHDHLLVDHARRDDALAAIAALRARHAR